MEASNVTIVKLLEQEKKGEKVETKEALKSASAVAACRMWYRRKQNEAVCSSFSLFFNDRHFLDLELPMSIGLFFSSSELSNKMALNCSLYKVHVRDWTRVCGVTSCSVGFMFR